MRNGLETAGVHLDGNNSKIKAVANHFEIQKTDGTKTFGVDAEGNIEGTGNAAFKGAIKSGAYGTNQFANEINADGSGKLAKGNIEWDANGQILFKGGTASPFEGLFPDSFVWKNYSDNYIFYGTASSYSYAKTLPTGLAYSGRRITIVNGIWHGVKSGGTLYLQVGGANDKIFYEDPSTGINPNRNDINLFAGECMQLLGYGDDTTFYGWIVLSITKIYDRNAT
jgi:hypothetical protein